ncbi:uncharacterized protein LOC131664219 [Phymastichus coffea]|uniref:uncharacterized protein LOC131664219 n=1 Tax=Phymastichus coffea TaxID=108790 RepID=UPI00273BCE20|nr:uncharacterized protein LOC131664219 [Phymastichus coffea]XP_058791122.1 uncharacterized protein LOC131664219 [Phymastichus coffea]XP_058791123.1 uncharacterized protein LOC131664219 [Phymastichus coffea]
MGEVSGEVEAISAEYALADVLDDIFEYLKIRDLSIAGSVCKMWHQAALRILAKRGPERQLLPAFGGQLYTVMNVKPFVAFLFIGPSKRERNIKELEIDVLNRYKKFFTRHLIAVGVDESMMDDKPIISCDGLLGTANGILGLFIPQYRGLQIKVKRLHRASESVSSIINSLVPDDKSAKTAMILFARPYGYDGTILEQIKRTFKQKRYTLWGGSFDDKLLATDRMVDANAFMADSNSSDDEFYDAETIYDDGYYPQVDHYGSTAMFALSISGSKFDSWSTMINCLAPKLEVDKKLLDFRQHLKLKRRTIGLACGPRYVEGCVIMNKDYEQIYMTSHELMDVVKKTLPGIPFIGIFNFGYYSHFGVDSTIDDSNQRLGQQMALALMILTYD